MLLDTGDDDLLVARVTSAPAVGKFDVRLQDWQDVGLLLPSTVRHKLATLEKRLVTRTLGTLSAADKEVVGRKLTGLWNPN